MDFSNNNSQLLHKSQFCTNFPKVGSNDGGQCICYNSSCSQFSKSQAQLNENKTIRSVCLAKWQFTITNSAVAFARNAYDHRMFLKSTTSINVMKKERMLKWRTATEGTKQVTKNRNEWVFSKTITSIKSIVNHSDATNWSFFNNGLVAFWTGTNEMHSWCGWNSRFLLLLEKSSSNIKVYRYWKVLL